MGKTPLAHILSFQAMLNMPALSFLALLALAVLLLPQEEETAFLRPETTASDIVWSRTTAAGEAARISAARLQQDREGIVRVQEVKIEVQRRDDNNLILLGREGVTDSTYQQIVLSDSNGRLVASNGARISLTLATALYYLDGTRLQGEGAQLRHASGNIVGDKLMWESKNIVLRGNVHASYLLENAE